MIKLRKKKKKKKLTNLPKISRLGLRAAGKNQTCRAGGGAGTPVVEPEVSARLGVAHEAADLETDVALIRVRADVVAAVHEDGVDLDGVARLGLEGSGVGHEAGVD